MNPENQDKKSLETVLRLNSFESFDFFKLDLDVSVENLLNPILILEPDTLTEFKFVPNNRHR